MLDVRIKRHKYSIRTNQESNALFIHVRDFGHPIDWDNATTLIYNNRLIERNVIESSLIKKSWDCNLNLSFGMFKLDPILNKEITERFKVRWPNPLRVGHTFEVSFDSNFTFSAFMLNIIIYILGCFPH